MREPEDADALHATYDVACWRKCTALYKLSGRMEPDQDCLRLFGDGSCYSLYKQQ